MNLLRNPIFCFVFAAALTISVSAFATTRWSRHTYSNGIGNYGGGPGNNYAGIGCAFQGSTNKAYCPVVDNDTVTSYNVVYVSFANANTTQPVSFCISYPGDFGGLCYTQTLGCPSGGVCSGNMGPPDTWNLNPTYNKFLLFGNLTVGAVLIGYTFNYQSSI